MGGADYEIEVIGLGIDGIFAHDFGLQSQLHPEEETNLPRVLFPQTGQVVEIGVRVQQKKVFWQIRIFRVIEIIVLRKAHSGQSPGDSL